MPGVFMTTGAMFASSVLALGLAGVGLAGMFQLSSVISRTAKSMKSPAEPDSPPPPPKTLTELIIERKVGAHNPSCSLCLRPCSPIQGSSVCVSSPNQSTNRQTHVPTEDH